MTFDYRDVLLKAASRVEQGWHQGDFWPGTFNITLNELTKNGALQEAIDSGQPMCAEGAMAAAAFELGVDDWEAHSRFRVAIGEPMIHVWNDRVGRTAHEVGEAMRKAAE